MADTPRTSGAPAPKSAAQSPETDVNRRMILGRLRAALERPSLRFPPANPPPLAAATRLAVTAASGGAPELAARFAAELEALHATCEFVGSPAEARLALINRLLDWRNAEDANAKGMRIQTGQERMVLGWASAALPVEHVAEALADMGMHLVTPASLVGKEKREAVRHIRYGLSGAEAAFAATGSLLLAAGPQTPRAASLLPLHHIALVPITRLYPTVEAWLAEMRLGDLDGWLRAKPNVTLITGPSKSGDIEMILTLGVHGPKFLHVILFDDGVQDDEAHDAFWRFVPGGPAPAAFEPPDDDEALLPASLRAAQPPAAAASPTPPQNLTPSESTEPPSPDASFNLPDQTTNEES